MARGSSAGPAEGREPPGPCQWLRGDGSAGPSRSVTGWKFPASPGRELGLRALKGSFIPALPPERGPGLSLPPARLRTRPHDAPRPGRRRPAAAAAGAAAGGGPAARRLREPQGEAEGAPAAGGAGRGESAGAGRGCWGSRAGVGAGGATQPLCYCKGMKRAIDQRLSNNLAAAPGRAAPVPRSGHLSV